MELGVTEDLHGKVSCSREERAPRSRQGRVTRRFRGFWLVGRGFAVELRLVGAVSRRARHCYSCRQWPQKVFRILVPVS
jgi:hypothetical protein